MTSYRALEKLMEVLPVEEHGVRMRIANFFFEKPISEMPGQLEKMNEIANVPDVRHGPFLEIVFTN
jgi:hypothetical protein